MSIPQLPKVNENMKLEELANLVAMLIKEVTWIFDKNIDSSNTREIGGYRVTNNSLSSKNGVVGLSSESTPDDDIRIWAGDDERDKASFRVYESGLMVAVDAFLSGTITASQFIGGIITGTVISSNSVINVETDANIGRFLKLKATTSAGKKGVIFHDSDTNSDVAGIEVLSGDMSINAAGYILLNAPTYANGGKVATEGISASIQVMGGDGNPMWLTFIGGTLRSIS